VAALSGVVPQPALTEGLAALAGSGFEVVGASNLGHAHGLFAGTDSERLDGLHELARDESVEAIFFARGGHGVLRLLPGIDWDLLARKPRWFVGFSDLTPLLGQIVDRLGWVTLHGPMVAADPGLTVEESAGLRRALTGAWPLEVPVVDADGDWSSVEGRLAGGCLTMLAATLGTPWAPRTEASVLFLEDVHEPLYRVDRMMQQLRFAGALDSIVGIVLGAFQAADGTAHALEPLLDIVRDAVGHALPIAWGCPSGHCRPNMALALGARARVDARRGCLVLAAAPPSVG
jgi:muramoyltetrapeptide carboxypeptidase